MCGVGADADGVVLCFLSAVSFSCASCFVTALSSTHTQHTLNIHAIHPQHALNTHSTRTPHNTQAATRQAAFLKALSQQADAEFQALPAQV